GLWWVEPLPGGWMHALVTAIGVAWAGAAWCALTGRCSRRWLVAAALGMTYLGAIDVATYLNHYVLLVLAAFVGAAAPEARWVPSRCLMAPRALVAMVYVWAAVAKLDPDWLSGRTIRP